MLETKYIPELMTVKQAAARMALKPSTLRKWILLRRMPYVRLGKRAIRVPRPWIEAQLRNGFHEAIPEGQTVNR